MIEENLKKIDSAIAQRELIVSRVESKSWEELITILQSYENKIRTHNTAEVAKELSLISPRMEADEIDYYLEADFTRYPELNLEDEAVMGRIMELSTNQNGGENKDRKRYFEKAKEFVLGYKFGLISKVASKYSSVSGGSITQLDLCQTGFETLVEQLPYWDWRKGSLATFTLNRIGGAMREEVARSMGRSKYTDTNIWRIHEAMKIWANAKGDWPTVDELARTIAFDYFEPDNNLPEGEREIREYLRNLGEKMSVFPTARETNQTFQTVYTVAKNRIEFYLETERLTSNTFDIDDNFDKDEDDADLHEIIGTEMDKSHLTEKKIQQFENLVEQVLDGLTDRQKRAVQFLHIENIDGNNTFSDLAKHLGVKEREAKSIYEKALRAARRNRMKLRELKNFYLDEGYLG